MNELLTTAEVAQLLGITREGVFQRIKRGKLKARKLGRNYVIRKTDLPGYTTGPIGAPRKRALDAAVVKTVVEYGETLRLLGQE